LFRKHWGHFCERILKMKGEKDSMRVGIRKRRGSKQTQLVTLRITTEMKLSVFQRSILVRTHVCKLKAMKNKIKKRKPEPCSHQNNKKFVACKSNVIYKIPCTCGACYIGQTGRCINLRLSEHSSSIRQPSQAAKIVPEYLRGCKGKLQVEKRKVLAKRSTRREREILEAFFIESSGGVFSSASTRLRKQEMDTVRETIERARRSRQQQ
jgi:hypothetical protein